MIAQSEEFLRQQIDICLKINLNGFKSHAATTKIAPNLEIRRGTSEELRTFFERAASFDKRYEMTQMNEFFAIFETTVARGSLSGLGPSNKLGAFAYFLSIANSSVIEANVAQLLHSASGQQVSGGFLKTPFDIRYIPNNQVSDSDLGMMRTLWPTFDELFSTDPTFALVVRRFYSSVTRGQWEDKLIDLIIVLEAFLLPEKGTSEKDKGGKIAKRLSRLLKDHWDRSTVVSLAKSCYKTRNSIMHGEVNSHVGGIWDTIEQLGTVTRTALQEYMLKYSHMAIPKFIQMIDPTRPFSR